MVDLGIYLFFGTLKILKFFSLLVKKHYKIDKR